jgi:hypothetical protein
MKTKRRNALAGTALLATAVFALTVWTTSRTTLAAAAKYDWPQFGFSPDKSANNTAETVVNAQNVSGLRALFKVPLADVPDGAPVLLSDVSTASGLRDLVFLQGEHGAVTAFDAHTGARIWSRTFSGGGISNSAPALDPNRLFLYANTNDGFVHKLDVRDGTEVTGGGWPELAGPGKSSCQLTIATAANGHRYLYAANQGHGHITTIDIETGSQHVFSMTCAGRPDIHFGASGQPNDCSVNGAAPWSRGMPYVADLDRVFAMGGTNSGTTWVAGSIWRQSWVALPADGSTRLVNGGGYPLDSYTPTDWQSSVNSDVDIGSGGIIVLPTGITARYPHLGVQPGKDSKIRLLDLANLSGQGAPGRLGGELQLYSFAAMANMRSEGAAWTNPLDGAAWAFVTGHGGIAGFQIAVDSAGKPSLQLRWSRLDGWTTSAIVANGVVYAATGGGEHTDTQTVHEIRAYNPTTGAILWSAPLGQYHWTSPILANGILYMVDGNSGGFGTGTSGNLMAWQLGGAPTPTPTSTATATPRPTPTATGGFIEVTPSGSAVTASTSDGNVPANAVDDNLGTRWSGNGNGAWLKLDLGSSKTVAYVTIAWYLGNTRTNRFDVQVSNDNATWSNVVTGATSGGAMTAEEKFDFSDVAARWVRYVGHGNSASNGTWNSVTEISVFSPAATSTPTPTATATATATTAPTPTATPTSMPAVVELTPPGSAVTASTNDGNVPSNAVDDRFPTRWSGSGDGAWLKLDLGSAKTLGYVTIAWYSGNTRSSRFDLQVSNDNATWSTVRAGATSSGTTTAEETFDFDDVSARWVRYVGHGNNDPTKGTWNSVAEISLWGPPAP